MQNNFFGSKLNSVLLLVLIVLMIIALIMMSKNKEMYLNGFKQLDQNTEIEKNQNQSSSEILGNKQDLVSFSIEPGKKVGGSMEVMGVVKGGYFFEANILVNILDINKNILKNGYGTATTDWMTTDPVSFTASIDFTGLNQGPAFIEIQNDDPSDGEGGPAKKILIPVIIN